MRDLVTNEYDLPTPSAVSPFFTAPKTIQVYFHVIMNGPDTGGTTVTISGSAFSGATKVRFRGASATFTGNANDSISATVPVGATTGTVSITGPNGTGTSKKAFKAL